MNILLKEDISTIQPEFDPYKSRDPKIEEKIFNIDILPGPGK